MRGYPRRVLSRVFTFSEYLLTKRNSPNFSPWRRSQKVQELYGVNVLTDKKKETAIKSQLHLGPQRYNINPTQGYRICVCACSVSTHQAEIKCSASLIRCLSVNFLPPPLCLCPPSYAPPAIQPAFHQLTTILEAFDTLNRRIKGTARRCGLLLYLD